MARTGFAIEGISNLKILGPLLHESGRFGIEPVVLVGRHHGKPYETVTPQLLHSTFENLRPANILYYDDLPFAELVKKARIRSLITLNPYGKYATHLAYLRKQNIATYGIDYFANSLYLASRRDRFQTVSEALAHLTGHFAISDFWVDLEEAVNPAITKHRRKMLTFGTPITDVSRYCTNELVDSVLSQAKKAPVICLLTPNIRREHLTSFYGLTTYWKIKRIIRLFQRYCRDFGYILVIKHREKQWDSSMYRSLTDYFLVDSSEIIYPHTTALVLQRTHLLVHFGSMAVMEAAAVGVPSIGISVEAIDKLHSYMAPHARQIIKDEIFSHTEESLFNFPSVSQAIPIETSYRALCQMSHQLIRGSSKAQASFDAYNKKFNGSSKKPSSEAILHHLAQTR